MRAAATTALWVIDKTDIIRMSSDAQMLHTICRQLIVVEHYPLL